MEECQVRTAGIANVGHAVIYANLIRNRMVASKARIQGVIKARWESKGKQTRVIPRPERVVLQNDYLRKYNFQGSSH